MGHIMLSSKISFLILNVIFANFWFHQELGTEISMPSPRSITTKEMAVWKTVHLIWGIKALEKVIWLVKHNLDEQWHKAVAQALNHKQGRCGIRRWTVPAGTGNNIRMEGDLHRSATGTAPHRAADITLLPRRCCSGPTAQQRENKSLSSHMKWKKIQTTLEVAFSTELAFQYYLPILQNIERTSTDFKGWSLFEVWNLNSKNMKVLAKISQGLQPHRWVHNFDICFYQFISPSFWDIVQMQ